MPQFEIEIKRTVNEVVRYIVIGDDREAACDDVYEYALDDAEGEVIHRERIHDAPHITSIKELK